MDIARMIKEWRIKRCKRRIENIRNAMIKLHYYEIQYKKMLDKEYELLYSL